MTDPATLSAAELLVAYRNRTLSPVEVMQAAYERLDRFEPQVNAFTVLDRDGALKAAKASEERWGKGEPLGVGDGVPTTIKDNIAWQGLPTRNGSRVTSDAHATFDAPAVARLKEAGAVLLGKTTMPEFGWKGLGDSPLTGITRNPWKLDRTTGGSSAGAAAAAALGIGAFHLGTDGAGSVRIPACFTGVVGLKATYGRVPAHPVSVMGELAHLGPLTRTVTDAALMLSIISQPDARDLTAWNTPVPDYRLGLGDGVRGLRIAWSPRLGYVKTIDPDVARATAEAAKVFAELGAIVEEADPGFEDPIAILETLWYAGAALALAPFSAEQRGQMDPGLVKAAETGEKITGAAVIEALMRTRMALAAKMDAFHRSYDLLLTPQMATPAIPVGADMPPPGFSGVADWGSDWTNWSPFTYPFNICQPPAISLPCGFSGDGLPIGLQIVGPLRAEALVLRAARAFEGVRPFPMPEAPRD